MDASQVKQLAQRLLADELDADQFLARIAQGRSLRMESATIDLDRQHRCGFPEVIFGQGKSAETLCDIFTAQVERGINTLATRVTPEQAEAARRILPDIHYNATARTLRMGTDDFENGTVTVVTAGTSDLPVAEEARETLLWLGIEPTMVHDVGVAGPHRLIERLDDFRHASAVVVIAGMEGALPSIVGGHVACPVIAVPTSVGYGASFGGVSALLGMLNSCASNVVVVNIDAGFKAAYVAGMIAKGNAICQ